MNKSTIAVICLISKTFILYIIDAFNPRSAIL